MRPAPGAGAAAPAVSGRPGRAAVSAGVYLAYAALGRLWTQ
ncbi:hypothetical protein [Streptomyces sp. NPDC005549]